jgi:hypothetical protein
VRGRYEFEVAPHQLSGVGTESNPFAMRELFATPGIAHLRTRQEHLRILLRRGAHRDFAPSGACHVSVMTMQYGTHREAQPDRTEPPRKPDTGTQHRSTIFPANTEQARIDVTSRTPLHCCVIAA